MKSLTKKQIIAALKYDSETDMCGWIGEFSGFKSDNHNLGIGYVTRNMIEKLENESIIEYIPEENFWVIKEEYKKACRAIQIPQEKINACESLEELKDTLNELTEIEMDYVDTSALPTFSDNEPCDTSEVYSWDNENILIKMLAWEIEPRCKNCNEATFNCNCNEYVLPLEDEEKITIKKIQKAENLTELAEILNNIPLSNGIGLWSYFPKFSNNKPIQLRGVYSWDKKNVLTLDEKWRVESRCEVCNEANFHCFCKNPKSNNLFGYQDILWGESKPSEYLFDKPIWPGKHYIQYLPNEKKFLAIVNNIVAGKRNSLLSAEKIIDLCLAGHDIKKDDYDQSYYCNNSWPDELYVLVTDIGFQIVHCGEYGGDYNILENAIENADIIYQENYVPNITFPIELVREQYDVSQIVELINNEFETDTTSEKIAAAYAIDAAGDAGYGFGENELAAQLDVLNKTGAKFDYAAALEMALKHANIIKEE